MSLGSTTPDALIEFGQRIGGSTALGALQSLHPSMVTNPAGMPRVQSYAGSIVDQQGPQMDAIRAEQVPVKPTHRNTVVPAGGTLTFDFWWFPIEALASHPLRESFRDLGGRRFTYDPPEAVVDLITLVSAINQAKARIPDWVDLIAFTSEPYQGKSPREATSSAMAKMFLPPAGDVQLVRYVLVTTRTDIPGKAQHPAWLSSFQDDMSPDEKVALYLRERARTQDSSTPT